ncbi:MAG: adenine deaminase [Flavisolibacter sp.]|jgi:adenine deaminase
MADTFNVEGNLVDLHQEKIYPARVVVNEDRITEIIPLDAVSTPHFILPGFIDAHVHIESSMLIPSEFARLAVVHGTIGTVSDPHEIANVCGMKGIDFMIENGNTVPFKFNFGAPSCVPATVFETAGGAITASDIENLMRRKEILYLSEMMNFPGVLHGDPEVLKKIAAAQKNKKPVDGHAPGLVGEQAKKYIDAGISTDHECFTAHEALDKLKYGMKIIIREGSAAKNFEALAELLNDYSDQMMFCSDDKHPDSLVEGHINQLCARAVAKGINVFNVLRTACVNPVNHYKLKCGLLRKNDFADFIIVKDLKQFEVLKTYINGKLVAENGKSLIPVPASDAAPVNQFRCTTKKTSDFIMNATGNIPIIEALDGQLITNKISATIKTLEGNAISDTENDILKIVVVNRYADAPVSKGFIKNFGLKRGAIASSVAHDSHNIVATGADDDSICRAVNLVIKSSGGVSCVDGGDEMIVELPVGGLMSQDNGYIVAEKYAAIDRMAKNLGSKLSAPYMTLSFMALLVIPHLKLSDLGLFDGDSFSIVSQ